jgi:vitamin B12 transporter
MSFAAKSVVLGIAALLLVVESAPGQTGGNTPPEAQDLTEPEQYFYGVVVTASDREETLSQVSSTVQILDRERIENSTAATVTQFLAENGIAFFSAWTPGQTQINIRGAASDGQGRDFRSQVLVLVNGRRSGTANISKFSLDDIQRIEILRGPASLIYGSQAIGGVVNLITRDGLNSPGEYLELSGGSFGRINSVGQYGLARGPLDVFLSVHGGRSGDYESGSDSPETMENTAYKQYGGLLALGFKRNDRERLGLTFRQDGNWDTGFRGSAWDVDNRENRRNQSFEATYRGETESTRFRWNTRYYYFKDVDDFRWGTEIVRAGNGNPAAGFEIDDNYRTSTGHGIKAASELELWAGNRLTGGLDQEWWKLENRRIRVPVSGGSTTQVPPFDVNSDSRNTGLIFEDTQEFVDGRLSFRGGARYDFGRHNIKETPNFPTLVPRGEDYDSVTWRAGAVGRPLGWLSLRFNAGTGFRSPTPIELASDFNTVLGNQIIGNPDLSPERTTSYETGVMLASPRIWADFALFWSNIHDRIGTVAITGSRSQYQNRAESQIRGLEFQSQTQLFTLADRYRFRLDVNGVYHWRFRDLDAAENNLNTDNIERMYKYQGSTRLSMESPRWSASLGGVYNGPVYYNTEENLLIPQGEPSRTFIHGKNPFWLLDTNVRFQATPTVSVWMAVNNLLDLNYHPLFIALNRLPTVADLRLSNGGVGNSLPGREFVFGIRFSRR